MEIAVQNGDVVVGVADTFREGWALLMAHGGERLLGSEALMPRDVTKWVFRRDGYDEIIVMASDAGLVLSVMGGFNWRGDAEALKALFWHLARRRQAGLPICLARPDYVDAGQSREDCGVTIEGVTPLVCNQPGGGETHYVHERMENNLIGTFISIPAWKTLGMVIGQEPAQTGSNDAVRVLVQENRNQPDLVKWYTLEPGQFEVAL